MLNSVYSMPTSEMRCKPVAKLPDPLSRQKRTSKVVALVAAMFMAVYTAGVQAALDTKAATEVKGVTVVAAGNDGSRIPSILAKTPCIPSVAEPQPASA